MLKKRFTAVLIPCLALLLVLPMAPLIGVSNQSQRGEMAGYLGAPHERVPETFGGGFSMYVAAWPLL